MSNEKSKTPASDRLAKLLLDNLQFDEGCSVAIFEQAKRQADALERIAEAQTGGAEARGYQQGYHQARMEMDVEYRQKQALVDSLVHKNHIIGDK